MPNEPKYLHEFAPKDQGPGPKPDPGPPGMPGDEARLPGGIAPLWTVAETARFLRKSPRWVFYGLRTPDTEPGSIPHVKLGRTPRFSPEVLRLWVSLGCPPVAVFKNWTDAEGRRRNR